MTALTIGLTLLALATPAFPAHLAGHWRSPVLEVLQSSDVDKSVFGPGASSTRVIDVVILPSGKGTMTVTRKVLDSRRRTVPGTPAIDRVEFTVGPVVQAPTMGPRPHYAVSITKAERTYPDLPQGPSPLSDLEVQLVVDDTDRNHVDVSLETSEEAGSFAETLSRVAAASARKPTS
jgi:hypothetical protein